MFTGKLSENFQRDYQRDYQRDFKRGFKRDSKRDLSLLDWTASGYEVRRWLLTFKLWNNLKRKSREPLTFDWPVKQWLQLSDGFKVSFQFKRID